MERGLADSIKEQRQFWPRMKHGLNTDKNRNPIGQVFGFCPCSIRVSSVANCIIFGVSRDTCRLFPGRFDRKGSYFSKWADREPAISSFVSLDCIRFILTGAG